MRLPSVFTPSIMDGRARERFEWRARECERYALMAYLCPAGEIADRYRTLAELHAMDAETIARRYAARHAVPVEPLRWRDLWPFLFTPALLAVVILLRWSGAIR